MIGLNPTMLKSFPANGFLVLLDRDYPPWLQASEAHPLPVDLLRRFGERRSTSNGDHWIFRRNARTPS